MSLIILEGPNGAGKSTIARRLSPDFTLKAGPPGTKNPYVEWIEPLLLHAAEHREDQQLIVCDRWHIGEAVYPALLVPPRDRIASNLELSAVSRTLSGAFDGDVHIAWVLPDKAVLKERFEDRGEHWQVGLEQSLAANDAYWELLLTSIDDKCKRWCLFNDRSVDSFVARFRRTPEVN